ncbi:MAG: FAD-binding oxidoreductase [Deltaproteobacteria bacterium]|nr:FAD-binding oxidoreductase [Deltaproteobacteria bacterium]
MTREDSLNTAHHRAKEVYARASHYHGKIKEVKEMFDPHNIMNPGKLALG